MEKHELLVIINALARLTKNQYRELLVHRAFAQYAKELGFLDVDEIIESARQSPEVRDRCEAYARALDAQIPPFDEELQEEALRKWLATLPKSDLLN